MSDFKVVYDNGVIAKERREQRLRELYLQYSYRLNDLMREVTKIKNEMRKIKAELRDDIDGVIEVEVASITDADSDPNDKDLILKTSEIENIIYKNLGLTEDTE